MADNVTANSGSGGPVFATDEVGGAHYPYGKLAFGADNTATIVSTSNGLPVAQQGSWTVAATQSGTWAVNLISGQTGIAGGSGVISANTVRVTLATDDEVNDGLGFVLTTLGSIDSRLAGTLTVSSHAVTVSGEVDVTPASPAANSYLPVRLTDGSSFVSALPITDNSGSISVDDNGGAISVDDNSGSLTVDAPVGTPVFVRLSDGSSAIATLPVSLASVPSHAVTNAGTFATQPLPSTSGGCSVSRSIDLSGSNQGSTVAKASAGQIYGWAITNTNASVRYVKLYDKASGPTSGDTPIMTIMVPAGGGNNKELSMAVACSNGIGFRATTGVADNDANAVAANEVIVNLFYK